MESGGKINVREDHKIEVWGNLPKIKVNANLGRYNSLFDYRFKESSKIGMTKRLYGLSGPYAYENT